MALDATDATTAPAAGADQGSQKKKREKFFGKLPSIVVRNPKLNPGGRVFLAYRSAFIGEYTTHIDALRPLVKSGLGRHSAQAAITHVKELGYLSRVQPAPETRDGRYYAKPVIETLTLPEGDGTFVMIPHSLLNGTLTVNELAVLIYIMCGTGRGPTVYRREVQELFDWCRNTTNTVLKALVRNGHIFAVARQRRPDGRIDEGYSIKQPSQAVAGTPYFDIAGTPDFDTMAKSGAPECGAPECGAPERGAPITKDPLDERSPQQSTPSHKGPPPPHSSVEYDAACARDAAAPAAPTFAGGAQDGVRLEENCPEENCRPVADVANATDDALADLREADKARVLAPHLLRNVKGLQAFLAKHGGEEALEVIYSILWRQLVTGGKGVASIRSWQYFANAIAEERHRKQTTEEGIRPGDVFGAHRWRPAAAEAPAPIAAAPTASAQQQEEAAPASGGQEAVLKSWRSVIPNGVRLHTTGDNIDPVVPWLWPKYLARYGEAPAHLKTVPAYLQALDIANELAVRSGDAITVGHALPSIAYSIMCNVNKGREIHSLGDIALNLIPLVDAGRCGKLLDIPSTLAPEALNAVSAHAVGWIRQLGAAGFPFDRDALLCVIELEQLTWFLNRYGYDVVADGISSGLADREHWPASNHQACAWEFFEQHIHTMSLMRGIEAVERSAQRAKKRRPQAMDPTIARLIEADQARVLAPAFESRPNFWATKLQAFLKREVSRHACSHGDIIAVAIDLLRQITVAERLRAIDGALRNIGRWNALCVEVGNAMEQRRRAAAG